MKYLKWFLMAAVLLALVAFMAFSVLSQGYQAVYDKKPPGNLTFDRIMREPIVDSGLHPRLQQDKSNLGIPISVLGIVKLNIDKQ